MHKCFCFKWCKKLFGLKDNCCHSHHEDKKDVNVTEETPVEPTVNSMNNEEATPLASEESVVEAPAEEKRENWEQK